ncbi:MULTISPECIES: RNA-directed DNA polymerase [unclassified Micromonospora]|uniref:RNA-directed DNA polymerase n=1 Tax=unclassified Micromonospora TaxID=2617518 RepID=UPI002492739F|nr:RNA-directed DNA polymerase [Micromonospora sp. AKA38]
MATGDAAGPAEYLDLAWSHVGACSGDLDLPDPIAFADMRHAWQMQREVLIKRILAGDTQPADLEVIDLPKNELLVRPLARVSLESRLMYEAAVLSMIEKIDGETPKAVFSHRWLAWQKRLYAPVGRWIKMFDEAVAFHRANPHLHMIRADISAFYENVDPSILLRELAALDPPKWAYETIEIFLKAFNAFNNVWGLPQGFDVTGVLANYYLLPVDQLLEREGLTHFRYSDDMFIFGEDWLSLRAVLLEITRTLRSRRLVLAGSKTEIVPSDGVLDLLSDARKNAINYGIATGDSRTPHELRRFFDDAVAGSPVDKRDFTFSLTKLGDIKDDYAVAWVLENIGSVPHASREALNYLGIFHKSSTYGGQVADFISNSKLACYPFAQQNVFLYLIRNRVFEESAAKAAWQILVDRNAAGFVREFAARYLGLHGGQYRTLLRDQFKEERDSKIRRALLVACYESGNYEQDALAVVSKSSAALRLTAEYLRSGPKKIPVPMAGRFPYDRLRLT